MSDQHIRSSFWLTEESHEIVWRTQIGIIMPMKIAPTACCTAPGLSPVTALFNAQPQKKELVAKTKGVLMMMKVRPTQMRLPIYHQRINADRW
jgi:hypothetical protein